MSLPNDQIEIRITNVKEWVVAELRRYADEIENGKIEVVTISYELETEKHVDERTSIVVHEKTGVMRFTLRVKDKKGAGE